MGGSAGYGIGVHSVYCFGKSKFTNLKTHLSVCHFDKTSLKRFSPAAAYIFHKNKSLLSKGVKNTGKSLGKLRKFR